ncbi:hypothetical protein AGMMS49921_06370 [Endomicrobiia bacterium]|nr:hypothetical protein AGMMS49921_06370 [Endomicrobiia bacterium]
MNILSETPFMPETDNVRITDAKRFRRDFVQSFKPNIGYPVIEQCRGRTFLVFDQDFMDAIS